MKRIFILTHFTPQGIKDSTCPLSDVVGWPPRNGLSAALTHHVSLGSKLQNCIRSPWD